MNNTNHLKYEPFKVRPTYSVWNATNIPNTTVGIQQYSTIKINKKMLKGVSTNGTIRY
jgi:hypothetical protein